MNPNNQSIENLKDENVLMCLLIEAHKTSRNILSLEAQIKHYKAKYPKKLRFFLSESEDNMQEYIRNLETEVKEEKGFLNYVIRNYCTDSSESSETKKISKNRIGWN